MRPSALPRATRAATAQVRMTSVGCVFPRFHVYSVGMSLACVFACVLLSDTAALAHSRLLLPEMRGCPSLPNDYNVNGCPRPNNIHEVRQDLSQHVRRWLNGW